MYLDLHKQHAVQYRERGGIIAVFLLSKPTAQYGLVDAVLDLTPLIKTGESPEFKCYTNHEGGTTWGKWGHVIGLADNESGKRRFAGARLAWRVNIEKKRFEEISEKTQCDTSGFSRTKARITSILTAIARWLFNTDESIATPCSVKTYGIKRYHSLVT